MSTTNVITQSSYNALSVYLTEARFEFMRMLRMPMFALPALIFPGMFYVLFGVLMGGGKGDISRYMLATYCIFGVMGPGLFGFGVSVAMEKDRGWLRWRRAVPDAWCVFHRQDGHGFNFRGHHFSRVSVISQNFWRRAA